MTDITHNIYETAADAMYAVNIGMGYQAPVLFRLKANGWFAGVKDGVAFVLTPVNDKFLLSRVKSKSALSKVLIPRHEAMVKNHQNKS
ncbi:MAG: BlaI/MecI/CopY family transcriptional regulator [Endozoicomonadaceae bacterium]|nr:BlaI/MecI/CopY family transcriptional regulator [Endozoicomonadaceae bacterium]